MIDFYLLIPCYNNEEGLIRSLQSVNYPHGSFIVVIVDDGSDTPLAEERIHSALSNSLSLQIIRHTANAGITKALNTGLEWIFRQGRKTLIARLDCNDLCTTERFYRQVDFMRQHPETDLVGSWCIFRDFVSGESFQYRTPTVHEQIRKSMHFRNVFIHPTVMWRFDPEKPLLYPENFPHAEDYGLFNEILINGKSAVIPDFLVTCALDRKGISLANRQEQLRSRKNVIRHYGNSKFLTRAGIIKLWALQAIPYSFLLCIKRLLYNTNFKFVNV